jgi:threonine synthase
MHKAFMELEALGLVGGDRPRFVAVQMEGCAPIVRAWEAKWDEASPWEAPDTRVWGLRVPVAIGDFLVLKALYETNGCALQVREAEVEEACSILAREEGLLAGPEGGAALLALRELERQQAFRPGDDVVVFQTGHPANYAET